MWVSKRATEQRASEVRRHGISLAPDTSVSYRVPSSSCPPYLFPDRRMRPSVVGVLRRSNVDLNFNGYAIPAGERVLWSLLPAMRSRELYPDPER